MEIDILNNRINNLIADKDYTERQYESLKKVYNDLAESHAKQVIEIGELQAINLSQKKQLLHYEINVLASKDAELEKLESDLLKAKELLKIVYDDHLDGWVGGPIKTDVEEFLNKK
jgi:hypothetical protein